MTHIDLELEIEKIISTIRKEGYKKVVIQLPDGLKPYAVKIAKEIEKKTGAIVFIWMGSNFGGCDIPIWLDMYGFDAIFHFGHTKFIRSF